MSSRTRARETAARGSVAQGDGPHVGSTHGIAQRTKRMSNESGGGWSTRGELILSSTEDGRAEIQLRAEGGTVWLPHAQMAELLQTSPQAIIQIHRSIFRDGELSPDATCNESLQVRAEGTCRVRRKIRDLLSLSSNYDSTSHTASDLFARMQNNILHAVTCHTAVEVFSARSDPESRSMALDLEATAVLEAGREASKNDRDEASLALRTGQGRNGAIL